MHSAKEVKTWTKSPGCRDFGNISILLRGAISKPTLICNRAGEKVTEPTAPQITVGLSLYQAYNELLTRILRHHTRLEGGNIHWHHA